MGDAEVARLNMAEAALIINSSSSCITLALCAITLALCSMIVSASLVRGELKAAIDANVTGSEAEEIGRATEGGRAAEGDRATEEEVGTGGEDG